MTNEEAITELVDDCNRWCPSSLYKSPSECSKCYIEMAIEALEKQVPKKPKTIQKFADLKLGVCPVCGSGCNDEYNYCLNEDCLQRLDWSDTK